MPITRPTIGFDCAQPLLESMLARVVASGVGFVCRYYSPELHLSKDLTRGEVQRLEAGVQGFNLVSVFETTAARALAGASAGQDDAWAALRCASLVGQPKASGIYFAVDFDAGTEQIQGAIGEYFKAAQAVLRSAGYRTGVYGNGACCQALLAAGSVELTWLAGGMGMAGSRTFLISGKWNLLQHVGDEAGLRLGFSIDSDEAQGSDWGQWPVGAPVQTPIPAPASAPAPLPVPSSAPVPRS